MTVSRSFALIALSALIVASGCGRKAALDTPSEAAREAQEDNGIGINRPSAPAAQPTKERRFILDSLI